MADLSERDRRAIDEFFRHRGGRSQAPAIPGDRSNGGLIDTGQDRRLAWLENQLFGVVNPEASGVRSIDRTREVGLVPEFATRIEQLERRLGPERPGPPLRPIPRPGTPVPALVPMLMRVERGAR